MLVDYNKPCRFSANTKHVDQKQRTDDKKGTAGILILGFFGQVQEIAAESKPKK